MYKRYATYFKSLIPAAYGGRYRSKLAFTMLYVFMFIYLPVYLPWYMLDVTQLLRMLYVLSLHYICMLMVRYYRYYAIVTYDICVMASVGR